MKWAVGFLVMAFALPAYSEVLQMEYSRFYSHVRKLDNEDTDALQFSFGFVRVGENRLCDITSAHIVTQKQTFELDVTDEERFTVPTDKALKMAEAVVRIDMVEPINVCDMSVQLETKPEHVKQSYTAEELSQLYQQYEAFFNEMGSFLSFMMPSVTGLLIQFEDLDLTVYEENQPRITNGMLRLDKEWLEQGNDLQLPEKPLRITAIASAE